VRLTPDRERVSVPLVGVIDPLEPPPAMAIVGSLVYPLPALEMVVALMYPVDASDAPEIVPPPPVVMVGTEV